MISALKRPPVYDAEFHEHVKRFRLAQLEEASEDLAPGSTNWATAEEVIAAALASASACGIDGGNGRRSRGSNDIDDAPQEPVEKRHRVGCGPSSLDGPGGVSTGTGSSTREEATRGWAQAIVKALHGCPSVEEASKRCARVLEEFEAEVRQATLNEVEQAPPPSSDEQAPQEGSQELKHTSRILMRAVHHLAERCRRLEAGNEEMTMLRQALEQSQAEQRRLQHSNEVLQSHLRLSYGREYSDRPLPWGNASH